MIYNVEPAARTALDLKNSAARKGYTKQGGELSFAALLGRAAVAESANTRRDSFGEKREAPVPAAEAPSRTLARRVQYVNMEIMSMLTR